MPLREMPGFVFSHKNVLRAVLCAITAFLLLILQFIFMRKQILEIVFDVIVPLTAAVTFGCYAITMAMDRPMILIMPVTAYFTSLLIRQLIYVEVGVTETYPIITLLECIPYLFYCVSVCSGRFRKVTKYVLWGGCILIALFMVVLISLWFVYQIMLFSNPDYTLALMFGSLAILFIYLGMLEQLQIAGIQKRSRAHG